MSLFPVHLGLAVSAVTASCCVAILASLFLRKCRVHGTDGRPWIPLFAFCIAMVVLFIPVKGIPALYYLRGVLGEFSVTTLIWAVAAFVGRVRNRAVIDPRQRFILLLGFAVTALALYPAALGMTRFDPYAWGYFSTPFLVGAGLVSFIALAVGLHWAVFILCGALLAASLGVLPSTNAWDYLIDPAFAIFAIVASIVEIVRRFRGGAVARHNT